MFKQKEENMGARILKLYRHAPCNPWEHLIIRLRIHFSSYPNIASHVPVSGRILDLASGFGILSIYLAKSSSARCVKGVDISNRRVKIAREASVCIQNVSFDYADIFQTGLSGNDCILLIDALHYFPEAFQNEIIHRCYQNMNPGGTLLIRESNRDKRYRHQITNFYETVMTKSGFTMGEGLHFRRFSELKIFLDGLGFRVCMIPMWGITPFADTLMVCRKMDGEVLS